jgi:transcriptional regulator with XRE-family HTH domain
VDDLRIGRICRALRRRRGWRQIDLARRAVCHQTTISTIERGHIASLRVSVVRAVFAALDAAFDGSVTWRAGDLDRLLDERHAAIVEAVARFLRAAGWEVIPELTYSEFGDRGSIDLLAAYGPGKAVAVFEIKTDLTVIEETIRRHHEKTRLVDEKLARRQFGWEPRMVARILVVPEDLTIRRRVAAHDATLRAAYPMGSRQVRAWLAQPSTATTASGAAGLIGGIWFLTLKPTRLGSQNRGGPRRVRTARTQSARA